MSKIDDLIAELCPDGVESKDLGDCVEILDNLRKPVSKDKRTEGVYPYYGANGIQGYVDGYIFDGTYLLMGEDGSVIKKDKTPILNWASGKIWVNNHAHILSEKVDTAQLRYIYYVLATCDVSGIVRGTPPKINQKNMRAIKIPVPPIEVQKEIVNILDKFTQLEAELEAELEARKKQYDFYRNQLLNFGDSSQVQWRTLGEVLDYEQPSKYIVRSTEYNNTYDMPVLTAGQSFILGYTNEETGIYSAYRNRPVIIFDDFTTGNHWVDFNFKIKSSAMKILRPKKDSGVNFRYVYHYIQTIAYIPHDHARQWISTYSKFALPIPSSEEQDRIVSILDKFDKLTTDISEGLPAEIAARRKQYEYYRNKLLTFKEIA